MTEPPSAPRRRTVAPLAAAFVIALAAVALLAAAPRGSATAPTSTHTFLRGMTISCPRGGQIWGTPLMTSSLRELRRLGVGWVAIHPYGRVRRDGTVAFRPAAGAAFLESAVARVREEGMRLFWKPHLGYWGSFEWRGAIGFGDDEDAWTRFFEGYERFIVDQARFAQEHGVDLFAVGVEYERTVAHEAAWRRVIAAVRRVYHGRLTYAANWDGVARVPFWDALDLIGVQAYFPLAAAGSEPSRKALLAAWDAPLAELRRLSASQGGKPVLVTEIGYNRSPDAAHAPWSERTEDTPAVRRLRERLIEVALERLEREPEVAGLFWWKWIPGSAPWDRDFSMKDPEAQEALARYWAPSPSTPASAP